MLSLCPGEFTPIVCPGELTPIVCPGELTPIVCPGEFTPIVCPGEFTLIVCRRCHPLSLLQERYRQVLCVSRTFSEKHR